MKRQKCTSYDFHKEGKNIVKLQRSCIRMSHTFQLSLGGDCHIGNITTNKRDSSAQALSEKKCPTQVAIGLGSVPDETEKFYTNFWRLEGLYELYNIYKEYHRNLKEFLHLLKSITGQRITTRRGFNQCTSDYR